MLTDGNAAAMETWVGAASGWGEAAQGLVEAAADLALASRSLADSVDGVDGVNGYPDESDKEALAVSLRLLGEEVEKETAALRDRYLATAANLEQYRAILG